MTSTLIVQGNAKEIPLAEKSVHAVVTSPPYWRLRKYSGDMVQIFGGNDDCQHSWIDDSVLMQTGGVSEKQQSNKGVDGSGWKAQSDTCCHCGAWRGDLGLEPTPEMYVENIVEVFREVRRVLRDDGTVWLNLGSSYASGDMRSNQHHPSLSVNACGIDDKEHLNYPALDYAYRHLCDEHLGDFLNHLRHTQNIDQHREQFDEPLVRTTHDNGRSDCALATLDALPLCAPVSTSLLSFVQLRGSCSLCSNRASALTEFDSCAHDVPLSAHSLDVSADVSCYNQDNAYASASQARRNQYKDTACEYCNFSLVKPPNVQPHCTISTFKQKDLVPIPWMVAMALQADGWYLRSDTIWAKSNPMPESVNGWRWERHRVKVESRGKSVAGIDKYESMEQGNPHAKRDGYEAKYIDCPGCEKCNPNNGLVLRRSSWRPTKSHEYMFMLTKSNTYFADADAVREANADPTRTNYAPGKEAYSEGNVHDNSGRERRNDGFEAYKNGKTCVGRNRRSVWTISTQPYGGPHFATFPEALVEPCIMASTSEYGCCPKCGAGWARVVERERGIIPQCNEKTVGQPHHHSDKFTLREQGGTTTTLRWKPTCNCGITEVVPAIVYDPFLGSGTTLITARRLGRDGIGTELSYKYTQVARERLMETKRSAWEKGESILDSSDVTDLPLFSGEEN